MRYLHFIFCMSYLNVPFFSFFNFSKHWYLHEFTFQIKIGSQKCRKSQIWKFSCQKQSFLESMGRLRLKGLIFGWKSEISFFFPTSGWWLVLWLSIQLNWVWMRSWSCWCLLNPYGLWDVSEEWEFLVVSYSMSNDYQE